MMMAAVMPPQQQPQIQPYTATAIAPPPPSQPATTEVVQTQSWAAWLLDAYASTATSPVTADFPHDDDEEVGHVHERAMYGKEPAVMPQQQQQQQQRWYHEDTASTPTSATTSTISPAASNRSYSSSTWGGNTTSSIVGVAAGRSVSAHTPSSKDYAYNYFTNQQQQQQQQQPYARTGRGGAGNYVWGSLGTGHASVVVAAAGDERSGGLSLGERRAAARRLQRIETVPSAQEAGRVMSVGRGGAGNYAAKKSPTVPVGANEGGGGLRSVSAPTPGSAGVGASSGSGGYGRGGAGNVGRAEEDRERKRREVREREVLEEQQRRERIEALVDGWLMPPPTAMVGVGRRGSWEG